MTVEQIIRGQKVDRDLLERAKQFRREMTVAERVVWHEIRAGRLNGLRFRRQQVIDGRIVDFYCHAARLIVEVDGPIHDEQRDADALRDEALTSRGLRILHFTNTEILTDIDSVLDRIASITSEQQP